MHLVQRQLYGVAFGILTMKCNTSLSGCPVMGDVVHLVSSIEHSSPITPIPTAFAPFRKSNKVSDLVMTYSLIRSVSPNGPRTSDVAHHKVG